MAPMDMNGQPLAAEIVQICSQMYQKGFIASSEGNVSVRLGPDRLLITPRGAHKGFLQTEQLVITDLAGRLISGVCSPSTELQLHLAAYDERPDITAVVHAHPTTAIACTLANVSLADGVLPEVIVALGAVPTVPYTTPGTPEAGKVIRPLIRQFDALLLARHGSVTIGKNLHEAYVKLEMLEHAAQILLLARLLGPVSPLPLEEVDRLLIAGGRAPLRAPLFPPRAEQELTAK